MVDIATGYATNLEVEHSGGLGTALVLLDVFTAGDLVETCNTIGENG